MNDSNSIIKALKALEAEALDAIKTVSETDDLERLRITYMGRKEGSLSVLLRELSTLDSSERPAIGAEVNRVKDIIQNALKEKKSELTPAGLVADSIEDLTLPGRFRWMGGIHPVNQVIDEIWQIFRGLGFTRVRGPEVDDEWYNFEALNTPLDHPAADEQDTIYLNNVSAEYLTSPLLRSHTSPVQIRVMQSHEPPIRILAPGMVYRRDTSDATHTPAFAQIEGLVIDEGITFLDFKATLAEFARRFWGPDTKIRFRPSFFPFTEPSAEVDVKRQLTMRDGTKVESDWIEIMGAGMVDPNVLENVGYDAERYTGFAFGMGPSRIALLKYGVSDLRLFFENDTRFLAQFSRGPLG